MEVQLTYQTDDEREAAIKLSQSRRRQREGYKIPRATQQIKLRLGKVLAPEEVLLERERRLSVPISRIQELLGDPRPGYRERLAELERQRLSRLYAQRAKKWASL